MIGGFIIGATSNYVVRAIGPSLAKANVPGALQDPKLELRDGNGTLVAANDDWASDLNAAQVQAVGLAPRGLARKRNLPDTVGRQLHSSCPRDSGHDRS